MSDNHQAELLARWLSGAGRGELAPEELEADAVEAVFALRADLAPTPRVGIDDILDGVEVGPFAVAAAEEAAVLADWLDSIEDGDADLDMDIQEAIYALRPDLAPAPRVTMDDIFGTVTGGPFAQAAAEPEGTVVSLAAAREKRASKRRSWWALPGVGAIAAAAVALLMINPAVMNMPEPMQDLAMEQMTAPPPAVSEPVPAPAAAPELMLKGEAEDLPMELSRRTSVADGASARESGIAQQAPASAGSAVATDAPAGGGLVTEPLDTRGYVGGPAANNEGVVAAFADEDTLEVSDDFDIDLSAGDVSTGRSYAEEPAAAEPDEAVVVASESAEPARSRDREGLSLPRLGRNKDEPTADMAPAVPEAPMAEAEFDEAIVEERAEQVETTLSDTRSDLTGLGQPALLDRLRASAWSLQPVPDIGAKYPNLAATYTAADAEWNAGHMDVAVGLLAPFAAHPDPDVVLDVTWNHAQMRYRMGEILGALEVIEKGLRVSGGSALLRSRLYALQGQLQERRGQPEEAIRSYRQAVEVR